MVTIAMVYSGRQYAALKLHTSCGFQWMVSQLDSFVCDLLKGSLEWLGNSRVGRLVPVTNYHEIVYGLQIPFSYSHFNLRLRWARRFVYQERGLDIAALGGSRQLLHYESDRSH